VKFADAIPTVPLFTVNIDANFYGYVYLYYYVSVDHWQEGKSIQTSLDTAAKIDCKGQVTGNSVTVTNYDGASVFPNKGASRIVNGQLYVYRTSLIPSPLVDSSQNVPVMKLTLKCEGQRVNLQALIIRKLGTVAQNQITVRIYWDQMNDTVNKIDGNDLELDIAHSGNFIGNQITFNPNIWVNIGTDYNILIAYSLGLGTAGWTCGCSVSALEITAATDAPNNQNAFPNQCLNAARNPPIAMTTPTVNIKDRGELYVYPEDISPSHGHRFNSYYWMKLTFWAEGESINVNRIMFVMQNVTLGEGPASYEDIAIFICWDKNNNSVYEVGTDGWISNWQYLNAGGQTTFLAFPLFEVKPRTAFNLLVKVYFGDNVALSNLRMNITDASCIQSGGQTSGQSIMPIATFPILTAERQIRF
jgi:hypothetical protein